MRQNVYTDNFTRSDAEDRVIIRIYDERPTYAKGGLVAAAQKVRRAGAIDDDVLLHVTRGEFEDIQKAWGPPSINPRTGLPEYSLLKKIGKGLKKIAKSKLFQVVAPIAASIFLPGVGGLIAQSLIGATSSKVNGGNPLLGALTGAAGHLIGGGGIKGTGANASGKLTDLVAKIPTTGGAPKVPGVGIPEIGPGGMPTGAIAQGVGATAAKPGILARMGDVTKPALEKALAVSSSKMGKVGTSLMMQSLRDQEAAYANAMKAAEAGGEGGAPTMTDSNFGDHLPDLNFSRRYVDPGDLRGYGRDSGEFSFFENNEIPRVDPDDASQAPGLADGGGVRGPGTGRSDDIDARLSDGEYIFDAESVAMLGDGSVDAGARKLDELRRKLRQHKGRALAKGKFSPNAKEPHKYLSRGGEVVKALKSVAGNPRAVERYEKLRKLEQMRRMERSLQDIQRGGAQPVKKAKGGKIRGAAMRELIQTANEFERALKSADRNGIAKTSGDLDAVAPGASMEGALAFSRGGSVMAAIRKLIGAAEGAERPSLLKRRSTDMPIDQAFPNQQADLSDIAAMLEMIQPKSGVLRQYKSDRDRRLVPRRRTNYVEAE